MEVVLTPVAESEHYPALFRRFLLRGLRVALKRVPRTTLLLSSEDREQALQMLTYGLGAEEAWPETRELLLALIGPMEQTGLRDQWMSYLHQGVAQSQQLGDGEAEAEFHFALGVLNQQMARFQVAIDHFRASEAFFKAHDPLRYARALNRQAFIARLRQKHDDAIRLADAAASVAPPGSSEEGYSAFVRGSVAEDRKAWELAQAEFEHALAVSEASGDPRAIARSLTNLGPTYHALGLPERSIANYTRAIELFEASNDRLDQARARNNLSVVLLNTGRVPEALAQNFLAEPVFRELQEWANLAAMLNNRGVAYQKIDRLEEAVEAFSASIATWQRVGTISAIVNVMDNLGLAYAAQGKREAAIAVFEEALALLTKIEGEATHAYLLNMVTSSLRTLEGTVPTASS